MRKNQQPTTEVTDALEQEVPVSKSVVRRQARQLAPITTPVEPTVESLLDRALSAGASVETLEKLLALRDKLRAEKAREAYYAALSAFQGECPIIKKNKSVKNKDGKSTRYMYATAEQIEKQTAKLRAKHGFSHIFRNKFENDMMVRTIVIQHVKGHCEESSFGVPIDKEAYMNNQQQVASARTFCDRYALMGGYGMVTGDTDDDALTFGDEDTKPSVSKLPFGNKNIIIPEEVQNEVHEKTLMYLDERNSEMMKNLWSKYGPEEKPILWKMFNSSQRTAINNLIGSKGKTIVAGDV